MPAVVRHNSPTSNARSWAHSCSHLPGSRILAYPSDLSSPLTRSQPARRTRVHTWNQRSPRGLLFQSREQQVFLPVRANPHAACRRGGTRAPSPPARGAQATPGPCFLRNTALRGWKIVLANVIIQPTRSEGDAFKLKRLISFSYPSSLWDKAVTVRLWCCATAKSFWQALSKYRTGAAFLSPSEMSTREWERADFLMLHCH